MFKVLLVDDETLALEGMALLIDWQAEGFMVSGQAESGTEALRMIEADAPDLVVTDLYMPGMDGIRLMQRAREIGYKGAFSIISAHQDFYKAQKSLQYGAAGYLLKPIDPEEAARMLRRIGAILNDGCPARVWRHVPETEDRPEGMPDRMRRYVASSYFENISLQTMADALGHNAAYLGRLFQKSIGMSFRDYLTQYRLKEAAARILETNAPLYQIAEGVGYTKYAYFLSKFKQQYGMMPEQYRRTLRSPSPLPGSRPGLTP